MLQRTAQGESVLVMPGGRRMAFAEHGDPLGFPVLAFHGTPGSRTMYALADAPARALGLRLISPERPGYGISTPQPGRGLRHHVRDALRLAAHLGVARFACIGVSGGSPYAAGVAALAGRRVAALALVSPVGPMAGPERPPRVGRLSFGMFRVAPAIPGMMRGVFTIGRAGFLLAPATMVGVVMAKGSPADRRILARQDVRRSLFAALAEGLQQGAAGAAGDMAVFARPWDVPLGAIAAPTTVWQGLADRTVSVGAALHLARLIPGATLHAMPGAGHYWIFDHIEEVLQTVADATLANSAGVDG